MSNVNKKFKKSAKEQQLCLICMTRSINCKTVECSHQFCYRCLSKWGRRKGNCPICRHDIRKIHYKKKIVQPQFLKNFDDDSSMLQSGQLLLNEQNRGTQRPPQYYFGNFMLVVPIITNFQGINYYPTLPSFSMPYNIS